MTRYVVLRKGNNMKVSEILKLSLKQINDVDLSNEIEGVYIGDLLSFVMANGKTGALWLTVQKHLNVIAVADLNDFAGIIFVQNIFITTYNFIIYKQNIIICIFYYRE